MGAAGPIDEAPSARDLLPDSPEVISRATGVVSSPVSSVASFAVTLLLGIVLAATPGVYANGLLALVPERAVGRGREVIARLYEYRPAMMHAKTLVADGRWSAVGSMNFDNRSLALNDEANLVALDAAVGAAMDSVFRADLRYAREVTLAAFRQRPRWERLLEAGAALFSRVL